MGYMTVLSILNDGLSEIENNPKEFVEGISKNLNGKYIKGEKYQKTISFGVGSHCNQVDIHQSFHADNTQVFFAGWNSLVNMYDIIDNIQDKPNVYGDFLESTLSNLDWVIKDIVSTFLEIITKEFYLENFKSEKEVKNYFNQQLEESEVYKTLSVKYHLGDIFNEKKLYKDFEKQVFRKQYLKSFKNYYYYLENGYKVEQVYYVINDGIKSFEVFENYEAAQDFLTNNKEEYSTIIQGYGIYSIKLKELLKTQKPLYTLKEIKEMIELFISTQLIK